ncbi:MAG: ABC transporter permease [Candidatus Endonucleobacter bathymodioli]|uniref:Transport permease protein n=1 Tax=Candidatus Endonucleibacter bathymodioli TaxID=539814 RepID=A0AA90SE64_9GAMM|nr:ABC transporter permease [Candidatus Endonucleobacter bathymodioli]
MDYRRVDPFSIENIKRCITELNERRYLLKQLVAQQLILRYRRTSLGYLWTLVNPLVMMTIMAVVFSTLFKADLKTFCIFLFTGMIPWNLFNAVAGQSGLAFISNEGLIKKIYVPKSVFPLSIVLALVVDSVLAFVALFIIILFLGVTITSAIAFLPIAYALLFLFSLGVAFVVSVATVYFRDLQYVMSIALQALFFLTPVLYKPESLKGKVAFLMELNPVAPFIELFRAPLYRGEIPDTGVIVLASVLSVVSVLVGGLVLLKQENKLVFRL